MTWKDNTIMLWDGNKITDHNRSPLEISVERIEKKQRMVDGTLRRYVVAKKHTFGCSWEMLPHKNGVANALQTADGGKDGEWMENFHDTTDGKFTLTLRAGDGTTETFQVMISDFSKDIQKRGLIDFWNLSITLEEV